VVYSVAYERKKSFNVSLFPDQTSFSPLLVFVVCIRNKLLYALSFTAINFDLLPYRIDQQRSNRVVVDLFGRCMREKKLQRYCFFQIDMCVGSSFDCARTRTIK